jgi:two-component system, OmpR family, alkaline phosphatase synthesis response regulator PhoP
MAKECILIVEDEPDILELVRFNLSREGYTVLGAATGEAGLQEACARHPDLVLLDLMLPGIDGLEVCRRLKAERDTQQIPVVILTAKGEETDIVTGLELGADDYIVKPFSPKVLVARLRAVLRRRRGEGEQDRQSPLRVHELEIHPGRREVRVAGKPVELTQTEFDILHFLARRPGWVFTRYQIVNGVKGESHAVTDRAVDVQVVGLRRKLGPAGRRIETVRGVGYRFEE